MVGLVLKTMLLSRSNALLLQLKGTHPMLPPTREKEQLVLEQLGSV